MTTRYVGVGGNDSNTGLSWAQRKLTLAGVEATPVEAGDTVYVGPGTYRSTGTNPLLTCGVDGTSGAGVITYIGDYTGVNTSGTKGVVRLTTSAADVSYPNAKDVIDGNEKSYRTFKGFSMDSGYDGACIRIENSNWVIDECYLDYSGTGSGAILALGANQSTNTITNCFITAKTSCISFWYSADVDNAAGVVSNCILMSGAASACVAVTNVGGITVKNCTLIGNQGVSMGTQPAAGQTITVNNCILFHCNNGVYGNAAGFITEDYNAFIYCATQSTNVTNGGHSTTVYPALFDSRWFHEMVNGGNMVTPFDLSSASKIIDVAGTSPTTADMRSTTVQGTQREWGALEYLSTLDVEAGSGSGGAVSIRPIFGRLG